MLYILITILVFIFSKKIYKKLSGVSKHYPFNFIYYVFIIDLVVTSLVGSLLIVLNLDNSYTLERYLKVTQHERIYSWIIVIYTILSMPIGMKISQYLFKVKNINNSYSSFVNSEMRLEKSYNGVPYKLLLMFIYIVSISGTIYTYTNMKDIPLFLILAGEDALRLAEIRIDVSRNFSGISRIKDINSYLAPLLSYISYCFYRKNKNITNTLLAFILFMSGLLMVSYSGAKSSIAFFFLGYIFISLYLWKKQDKKNVLLLFILIFLSIVLSYLFIAQKTDIKILLSLEQGILGRVFVAQIEGLVAHLNVFPNLQDYTGLSSFLGESISSILNMKRNDFSYRTTALIAWGSKSNINRVGVMNTLFVAEAYAAFGFLGVLLSPIYVGFYIQSVFLYLIKIRKTPFSVGLLAYLSCRTNITGSFNAFLYNPYTMFIVFLLIMILFFSRFFSISIKGKI